MNEEHQIGEGCWRALVVFAVLGVAVAIVVALLVADLV